MDDEQDEERAEVLGASSLRKYGSHAEAVRAEMKRRTTPETDHE
jgi:hypothetical protein